MTTLRRAAMVSVLVAALSLPASAQADHVAGHVSDASWSCRASVARLAGPSPPDFEPLVANSGAAPCADDSAGPSTIALPPSGSPAVTATAASAATEVLCAEDDPDPTVDPSDNDDCDAGHRTFDQQVDSRAGATTVSINVGSGDSAINLAASAANTQARAFCNTANQVELSSQSTLVTVLLNGTPVTLGGDNQVINVGAAQVILNERAGPADGPVADNSPGESLTRRAIHIVIPGGPDVVVAESTVDFEGDACPEGRLIVRKETGPDEPTNSTQFGFGVSGGLAPTFFALRDDGEQVFEDVVPNTYVIAELGSTTPYDTGAIVCADPSGNTTTDVPSKTAFAAVGGGETVVCTFVNTKAGLLLQCPFGTAPGPGNTCVLLNVVCPPTATFDFRINRCVVVGGRIVALSQVPGHRNSPCRTLRRFGPAVAIIGTNGPDRITGTNRSDRIFTFGGDDRISGGRGDDCIEAGSGRDFLDGSNGNDFLLGGSGRDLGSGGPGADLLRGSSGNDNLGGGNQGDRIFGGAGRDRIRGEFGNDRLVGNSGNDGIATGSGRDRVNAGTGNDVINAAIRGPASFVRCGSGRDRLRINNNERRRHRSCEFVDVFTRIKRP